MEKEKKEKQPCTFLRLEWNNPHRSREIHLHITSPSLIRIFHEICAKHPEECTAVRWHSEPGGYIFTVPARFLFRLPKAYRITPEERLRRSRAAKESKLSERGLRAQGKLHKQGVYEAIIREMHGNNPPGKVK